MKCQIFGGNPVGKISKNVTAIEIWRHRIGSANTGSKRTRNYRLTKRPSGTGGIMKTKEMIINNNRVYWNGYYWVVESADGSWDGFEFYLDRDAAIEAAKEPNSTEE